MTDSLELDVLQLLRLKGRTTIDVLATALGQPESAVTQAVDDATGRGLIRRGATLRMSPEGRERLTELLDAERATVDQDQLAALYEEFHPFNSRLKTKVTAWQIRPDGTVNEHTDEAYDQSIVDAVTALHGEFADLLSRLTDTAPRLRPYPARFDRAVANVAAGDRRYLVAPIIDSYHTVWFELHEDLIGLLGLTRLDEASSGRAD